MHRVAVKTLGCRLNQAESADLLAACEAVGFTPVAFGSACELCIIHGCAITGPAERESLRAVRAARRLPGRPFVILAGCAAQALDADAREKSGADLVLGQVEKPQLADRARRALGLPVLPTPAEPRLPRFEQDRAWLKVQDGCDFRCAYCIVPALRGPPVSRPMAAILQEADRLIEAGFQELVLTGANLGCWREDGHTLPHLIERLAARPGRFRLRLGSIELSTVEQDVIACMADMPKLCRFLHLPLQSGDDRILAAMGRRYTAARFRAVAEAAAARVPRLGLGTDVIAGFPGEDEAAFAATRRLLEELPFSNIHPFPFSPRPGTRAATMAGTVPPAVRKARVAELLALKTVKRAAFAASFHGQVVELVVERNPNPVRAVGWSGEYLETHVQHDLPPRTLVSLRVTGVRGDVLTGELA